MRRLLCVTAAVLVSAAAGFWCLSTRSRGPEYAAQQFVTALQRGDEQLALSLMSPGNRDLLRPAGIIWKPSPRLVGRVEHVSQSGNAAEVVVSLSEQTLTLRPRLILENLQNEWQITEIRGIDIRSLPEEEAAVEVAAPPPPSERL